MWLVSESSYIFLIFLFCFLSHYYVFGQRGYFRGQTPGLSSLEVSSAFSVEFIHSAFMDFLPLSGAVLGGQSAVSVLREHKVSYEELEVCFCAMVSAVPEA